jgi:uncharacterized membrane protein
MLLEEIISFFINAFPGKQAVSPRSGQQPLRGAFTTWIWEQGGGYFGVPLTNYLGWFFTVYVFFQLVALYLRLRKASQEGEKPTLPRSYYAQAIVMYAVIGLVIVVNYLMAGPNTAITDAVGVVWQTRSIAEAEATVSIFTMLFAAALALLHPFYERSLRCEQLLLMSMGDRSVSS